MQPSLFGTHLKGRKRRGDTSYALYNVLILTGMELTPVILG